MKSWVTIGLFCLLGAVPLATGQAAPSAPAHGSNTQNCAPPFVVTQVLAVISAGTIFFCADAPTMTATTASTFQAVASLTAPQFLGAVGTNTITLSPSSNGCTVGTVTTRGTTFNSAFGTQFSATAFITMTSDSCTLLWEGKVVVATTSVVFDAFEATATYANPTSKVDSQNHLCPGGAFGSSCTNPTFNLDNENRLCASSTFGGACTTPTINAAITGSLTTSISGTLTLSGTVNAVISGTLDVLDRLCAASPTGTTCTIAGLNVHQDQACGASRATQCYVNSTATTTLNIGNATVPNHIDLTVHQDQACGASIPCMVSTTAFSDQVGILVPLLLVLILVIWAERTKNPILYLVAIVALMLTIIKLWAGLVGYRGTLIVVLAYLAFRLYLTATEVNKLED